MDGNRFDTVARLLASSTSRRTALRAMLAALGGSAVVSDAEARRGRPTVPTPAAPSCPVGQQCGAACCVSGQSCCNGSCCTGTCTNGVCCPAPTTPCGAGCCASDLSCCGDQCCDPSLCSETGAHCCTPGTNVCGEECCEPGDDCCDGECCAGTCFSEESCCPRPRIVCDGACCPAGDIACCDLDGCCDGGCTEDGLCCPAGTDICGESCCDAVGERCCGTYCIAAGGCCSDIDCDSPQTCGGGGTPNSCGCMVNTSCQSMGFNCGTFTNNCNIAEQCGACTPPDTCSADPAGVCHCVTSETCVGRCGTFIDICGVVRDCGSCPTTTTSTTTTTTTGTTTTTNPPCVPTRTCESEEIICGTFVDNCGVSQTCERCGTCLQCNASNQCEPAPQFTECGNCRACDAAGSCVQAPSGVGFPCEIDKCTIMSTCAADGTCQGGMPLLCPGDPQNRCAATTCDPAIGCVTETAQFDGQRGCGAQKCDPGICMNGSCLSDPVECPDCQVCDPSSGQCVDNPGANGASCADSNLICVQGSCCNMIGGPGTLDPALYKDCISETTCCGESEGPCCPGTGGQCCENCFEILDSGGTFVEGLCCPDEQMCNGICCWFGSTCVGTTCVRDEQICSGTTVCNDQCCGGDGTAGSGTCCGPNAYCVNGGCVPVQSCTNGSGGHDECEALGFGSSAQCAGGSCCPDPVFTGFGSGGPTFSCCPPEQRRSASGQCCGYPNYSDQCLDCSCSFSRVRRVTR